MKTAKFIPNYIIDWTDKYFHQSAFSVPLNYPSKRVVKFFTAYSKRTSKTKLYRGIHQYNKNNKGVTSWTYDCKIAERYAKEIGGKVIEKEIQPHKILLDTTRLTKAEKEQFGYDYKTNDKEVLVLKV